jgi:hypothetical protein
MKKFFGLILITILVAPLLAQTPSDQDYLSKLEYRRSKLSITVKKRMVDETRSYSNVDIDTTVFSYEAYTQTWGNISTSSFSQQEMKEITNWYIYKGALRELSDLEFLELTGEKAEFNRIQKIEDQKARMRGIGNVAIGVGLVTMIVAGSVSADTPIITSSALVAVAGFFVSSFNQSPHHYIQPDFAQAKIDEYNIALKQKLDLPLQFE